MNHSDIAQALSEIDGAVRGIQDPPVAKLFNDSVYPERESAEDYRRFYIEFDPEATADSMKKAVDAVADAIKRLRYA